MGTNMGPVWAAMWSTYVNFQRMDTWMYEQMNNRTNELHLKYYIIVWFENFEQVVA